MNIAAAAGSKGLMTRTRLGSRLGPPARLELLAILLCACGNSGKLRPAPAPAPGPGLVRSDDGGATGPMIALPDAGAGGDAGDAAADDRLARLPPACRLGPNERGNAGCTFYAVPTFANGCFVIYVVNPARDAVHINLSYYKTPIPLAQFGRRLQRTNGATVLAGYDEAAGLLPGEALVVFVNGPGGIIAQETCPVPSFSGFRGFDFWPARESTGYADAYRLTTDRPVVAYQFYGYGRSGLDRSSATLLLPAESWGKTTVVTTPRDSYWLGGPEVAIVAGEDDTEVRFRPTQDMVDVDDPSQIVRSGVTKSMHLNTGEFVQLAAKETRPLAPFDTAWPPLSGSIVSANKPVGVMGTSRGFRMPLGLEAGASHQQLPPREALGHEYAAVRYPDRLPTVDEETPWQIVGAADGTELTYVPAAPKDAPATLAVGQVAHFWSKTPFVVRSQDDRHPFVFTGYMTSPSYVDPDNPDDGPGAPVLVNVVPTEQYDQSYGFFTDPSFPETRLVVVRKKNAEGRFGDVKLACAGAALTGFRALGEFEFAQIVLTSKGKPAIPGCDRAVQFIEGGSPFAVTVWGWAPYLETPQHTYSHSAAYGYPAGARARPANQAPPIVID